MTDGVKIIFENNNFLVVDKPSGLVVHADGRTKEDTLVDWLRNFCNENNIEVEKQKNIGRPHTLDSGRYVDRWGVVNRLDRDTSGLVLISKNEETFHALQDLFANRQVIKRYEAWLWGKIDLVEIEILQKKGRIFATSGADIFLINIGITRDKNDPRLWRFQGEDGSRQSVRTAETLVVFKENMCLGGKYFTRVIFFPKTGRTHQLRLHSKYLGHPILGDKKYGFGGIDNCLKEDAETKLHLRATGLEFQLYGENFSI